MIFLEDLHEKNMVKPGMTFDLVSSVDDRIIVNFFIIRSVDEYGYNGFHPCHNNEIGRIAISDLKTWWIGRMRLNLSCYKKLQFDEQLNEL